MTGALIAAASGVGFGLFQSVNVRAARGVDPFVSTFIQLVIASAAMLVVTAAAGDLAELDGAPGWALVDFAIAGLLHFLAGWTLLNISQRRIGAARSSPLLTTVPVFGVAVAAVTLGQLPGVLGLAAIGVIVVGAWIVAARGAGPSGERTTPTDALPGLLCALCWAVSPVFTLRGLEHLNSPLLGVTVGLVASALAYGVALTLHRRTGAWTGFGGSALGIKALAGVLVAVATWGRWAALDFIDVGPVLALGLLSVPIVLFLAPRFAGRHLEHVDRRVWLGAGLVVGGSLLLIGAA